MHAIKQILQPFERFGMTEPEFKKLVQLHSTLNATEPRVRSSTDNPLYDWEAALIKELHKKLPNDIKLHCLIAALLQLVQDDVTRRRAEENLKLVPKPLRANTMGMFFPPQDQ